MGFSDIPVRSNGDDIVASWFNTIRTALIDAFGGGFLSNAAVTLTNNQATPTNVTGLLFSGAVSRSFEIDYHIYRNTTGGGATERAERGKILGVYKTVAVGWEMSQGPVVGDAGVTLTITSAGQVQYVTDNQSGTPGISEIRYSASTTDV